MSSPVCTESGFIGQSQRCCSLASCAQCSGADLLRTEMRIAEGVRSEWLGCCKRLLRDELNISEGSALCGSGLGQRQKSSVRVSASPCARAQMQSVPPWKSARATSNGIGDTPVITDI